MVACVLAWRGVGLSGFAPEGVVQRSVQLSASCHQPRTAPRCTAGASTDVAAVCGARQRLGPHVARTRHRSRGRHLRAHRGPGVCGGAAGGHHARDEQAPGRDDGQAGGGKGVSVCVCIPAVPPACTHAPPLLRAHAMPCACSCPALCACVAGWGLAVVVSASSARAAQAACGVATFPTLASSCTQGTCIWLRGATVQALLLLSYLAPSPLPRTPTRIEQSP